MSAKPYFANKDAPAASPWTCTSLTLMSSSPRKRQISCGLWSTFTWIDSSMLQLLKEWILFVNNKFIWNKALVPAWKPYWILKTSSILTFNLTSYNFQILKMSEEQQQRDQNLTENWPMNTEFLPEEMQERVWRCKWTIVLGKLQ